MTAGSNQPARDIVVSFLFPPAAETSGIVAAKRIVERGVPVDVIASEPPAGRAPDASTLAIADHLVRRVVRVPSIGNGLRDWTVVEHFCALGETELGRLEEDRPPYRTMHSRSMMPASHVLAALYKANRPATRWSAEFSDPLLTDTRGQRRTAAVPDTPVVRRLRGILADRGVSWPGDDEMFALVETLVWTLADEIVFTNEQQCDLMLGSIPSQATRERARSRAVVRAHPVAPAALYQKATPTLRLRRRTVNFAYFGVFYGVRPVGDLTEAIGRLSPAERVKMRLFIFTDKPRRTRRQVEAEGLDDVVRVRKFVPYLDFLALSRKFDVLVLADARVTELVGVNPYLPSKLSDYLGSGTPVWALVEPSSPTARSTEVTSTVLGDIPEATAQLRAWIVDREADKLKYRGPRRGL